MDPPSTYTHGGRKTKVEALSAEGFDSQVPTPPKGYGKSSGRGSCQANIRMNTQGALWFDPNKKTAHVVSAQGRSRGDSYFHCAANRAT